MAIVPVMSHNSAASSPNRPVIDLGFVRVFLTALSGWLDLSLAKTRLAFCLETLV